MFILFKSNRDEYHVTIQGNSKNKLMVYCTSIIQFTCNILTQVIYNKIEKNIKTQITNAG